MGIHMFKVIRIAYILANIPTCLTSEIFNLFEIIPAYKKGFDYS